MIIGEKVVIRNLEIGDEQFLYKWWNNEEMMSHAGYSYGTLQSLNRISDIVAADCNSGELFPSSKRFIICKKEDMTPIGEMNYCDWNVRTGKSEFGIKLGEISEQGRGYGFDACYHFIDFMFKHLNLQKVELTSVIDNTRAHNLYRKLGFKDIGIIRKGSYDSASGELKDVLYMDILKEEWEAMKKK